MKSIGDAMRVNSRKYPNHVCLRDDERSFTWSETNERVNRLANGLLALGCEPGDAIAVYARNSIEYVELFHACAKLGVRIVTLNYWLRMSELETLFNHSRATWLVVDADKQNRLATELPAFQRVAPCRRLVIGASTGSGFRDLVELLDLGGVAEPKVKVDLQAPFWMMYTSGTTGDPKGLVRSVMRTTMCIWAGIIQFGYSHDDVFLAVSPLFHGVSFLPLMVMQVGGTVHVARQFSAPHARQLLTEDITSSFMVPTMLAMIEGEGRLAELAEGKLRLLITGGAPVPERLKRQFWEQVGSVLYEFYGTSESGFLSVLSPEDQLSRPGSSGRACFGAELEILDEAGNVLPPGEVGEVHSHCEGRFDEYFNAPAQTAKALKNSVYATSDLGRLDEDGYLYLVDRKGDMVISGGENIYPREIEDVLREHPSVSDCAVIGVPDDLWGEAVKAFVVPNSEVPSLAVEDLIRFCSARLAGFKRPKFVELIDELPRNVAGKVMKPVLRQMESARREAARDEIKE